MVSSSCLRCVRTAGFKHYLLPALMCPNRWFQTLPNMTKASEDVVDEILQAFPSPVVLNFSCQRLGSVPRLDMFPSVRILDLSCNSLTDLGDSLLHLPNLTEVNLEQN